MSEGKRANDYLATINRKAPCSAPEVITSERIGCVICLENVSEQAVALPCKHNNFDFICLVSWLQESTCCPLCKVSVTAVEYAGQNGEQSIYRVEAEHTIQPLRAGSENSSCSPPAPTAGFSPWVQHFRAGQRLPPRQFAARRRRRQPSPPPSNNAVLLRRKRIYELDLYCLHVGSNRLSGYSDLTPTRFTNDPHLVSRARKWIRRELQAFDFLVIPAGDGVDESGQSSSRRASSIQAQRASSNAEFLLEYIVAILKTVDIKGSKGQAQEMLAEFLGGKSALFLHELNAWLRSPFDDLAVWDRNVRYEWPEGEEKALKRTIKDACAGGAGLQQDWHKRRRVESWVPD